MMWILAIAAVLSLLIWGYLILLRGGFWRADQLLDPDMPDPKEWPAVVALVPARNESAVIGDTLEDLLAQNYEGPFRVVLVDDRSEDSTPQQAIAKAKGTGHEDRFTLVEGAPLPDGWSGKVWALAQGCEMAKIVAPEARYVLLTDADISHWLHNLRNLVAMAEEERLDMVSLMAMLYCDSPWERLLIPPFVFFFQKLFPFRWVNNPRRETAAAAGGCILVNVEALEAAGGFGAIRGEVIDNCALGARLKVAARKRGRGIWLGLAEEASSIRPYDGLGAIWKMVARGAYAQLGYSPRLLAATVAGMVLAYLVPPMAVILGTYAGMFLDIQHFGAAFLAVMAGAGAWGLMVTAAWPTFNLYQQPLWMAILLPLAAFFYTLMTLDSARRHRAGTGVEWKGRIHEAVVGLED